MRAKLKKAEEAAATIRELERRCKIYEETIKSKNPNSVAMLIQASKNAQPMTEEEEQSKKQLNFRIKQLEGEIDEKDKDFERRLRALRQEQERMRQVYEDRAANPAEAAKVNDLEKELQRTKDYYHKRIRELEDKYKFRVNIGVQEAVDKPKSKKEDTKDKKPSPKEAPDSAKQDSAKLNDKINELLKEKQDLHRQLTEAQHAA